MASLLTPAFPTLARPTPKPCSSYHLQAMGVGVPLPLSTSRRSPSADMTRYNFAARKILSGAPRLPDCGLPQSGDTSRGDAIFPQRISENFWGGLLGIAAVGFKGGVWRRSPSRVAVPSCCHQ